MISKTKNLRSWFVLLVTVLAIPGCGGGGQQASKVLPDPGKDASATSANVPTANPDGTTNENKK